MNLLLINNVRYDHESNARNVLLYRRHYCANSVRNVTKNIQRKWPNYNKTAQGNEGYSFVRVSYIYIKGAIGWGQQLRCIKECFLNIISVLLELLKNI